jgi:hypothetical protein
VKSLFVKQSTVLSKQTTLELLAVMAVATALLASAVQPAFSQGFDKDHGASELSPGQQAEKRPGWDPNGAPKYAPGHCIGCDAKDVAPGREALEDGIIGPDKPAS